MDTIELKDIAGVTFAMGDKVATDITTYKTTRLQVGTVVAFDGKYIKMSYEKTERWGAKRTRNLTVSRRPDGVVKVAQ
jgi:hypothetical protein